MLLFTRIGSPPDGRFRWSGPRPAPRSAVRACPGTARAGAGRAHAQSARRAPPAWMLLFTRIGVLRMEVGGDAAPRWRGRAAGGCLACPPGAGHGELLRSGDAPGSRPWRGSGKASRDRRVAGTCSRGRERRQCLFTRMNGWISPARQVRNRLGAEFFAHLHDRAVPSFPNVGPPGAEGTSRAAPDRGGARGVHVAEGCAAVIIRLLPHRAEKPARASEPSPKHGAGCPSPTISSRTAARASRS
jgi:hypothetical protein